MHRKNRTGSSLFWWVLIWLLAAVIVFVPIPAEAAKPVERTIRVEARSFAYAPAVISANLGDTINLELVSTDVVHGLYIDGYDLDLVAEPGQMARLTFVADQIGTFRLRCSVTCGDLHPFMIGKLTVGRNDLLWRAVGLSLVAALAGLLLYHQTF
jgi:heme/copper-type cytochrome/quinol oxidase subunit 2